MLVRRRPAGRTNGSPGQEPQDIDAYELDNGLGIRAVVLTYGATLAELWLPAGEGASVNVVVGNPEPAGYSGQGLPYAGATVGRFSRNVSAGRVVLDGTEYRLDLNDKGHHMHGGRHGFAGRVWEAEPLPAECALRLRLVSPDGDQGYPGELTAETTYRLTLTGIVFQHRATTTAATVVDLTNHTYWNLAGAGTIDEHALQIGASRAVRFVDRMTPAPGPPEQIQGTDHDFRNARLLRGTTIDRYFVLDRGSGVALTHAPSGHRMHVVTDRPGVGVYTADRSEPRRGGISLQASAMPDAPNRPDFRSVRLDPGQTYVSRTAHDFALR